MTPSVPVAEFRPTNTGFPTPTEPSKNEQPTTPVKLSTPPTRVQPVRARRMPAKYVAFLLPYLLCLFTILGSQPTDSVLVRDTVLFNEHPGLAFSESFWTVVTDIDLRPAEVAITFHETRIRDQKLRNGSVSSNEI